jgi:hypothetical protein
MPLAQDLRDIEPVEAVYDRCTAPPAFARAAPQQ